MLFSGLSQFVILLAAIISMLLTQVKAEDLTVEQFLKKYNEEYLKMENGVVEKDFSMNTDMTRENEEAFSKAQLDEAAFEKTWAEKALLYDNVTDFDQSRQLKIIKDIGTYAQSNTTKIDETDLIESKMKEIYSNAEICLPGKPCMPMDPNITHLMATSTDHDELLAAWIAWRDASGRKMKHLYARYVELLNDSIRQANFSDLGEYWRSWYEMPTFKEDLVDLLNQIRPLYEHLHAYVRRRLKKIYNPDVFPSTGHIPAHLLGDMWAQDWTPLIDRVKPFTDLPSFDVTGAMIANNYTVKKMFETAEDFFKSLGWDSMVDSFWRKTMMERPANGRKVVCHASAWDFFNGKDFAIKMCATVTQQDLMVIHHEMGHVQYYMHYKDKPAVYREGANNVKLYLHLDYGQVGQLHDTIHKVKQSGVLVRQGTATANVKANLFSGFHEAIGDVMTLSAQTPEHLKKIKLIPDELNIDQNTELNFLMNMALQKVAFIPFGYLIDLWRWSVFAKETTEHNYTKDWWDLRCKFQGVSPPVARTSDDFDPGAKYHVANNVPYIRYFISFIIQFQFHKAACLAANSTAQLHRCDIYNSTEAGTLIGDMLKMGRSQPWPDAMEKITGQRKMDAGPLLEYFKPLLDFLIKENGNDYGWDPKCPQLKPETKSDYVNPLETCNSNTVNDTISDQDKAEEFLQQYNTDAEKLKFLTSEAEFNYESNLTEYNKNVSVVRQMEKAEFDLLRQKDSWKFDVSGMPENIRRQFKFIRDIGANAQPNATKLRRLKQARLDMQSIYGKGEVCFSKSECLSLEPGLTQLLAESRDYDKLLTAWIKWRDATGPKMKKIYEEYVDLYNEAVGLLCFKDTGEYWRSWYDSATFEKDIAELYAQIRPLYEHLHAYVRRKLKGIYPKDKFPSSGHIPAHILGNMWAQEWTNLIQDILPFPNKTAVDVTDELVKQGYTPEKIFHTADDFFGSLGLIKMVPRFWEKSVITKQNNTDMVCHATAYDLYNGEDFRIKMCTDITQEDLVTVHHEMGHIEYYMQYKDQPIVFRDGANNGFHEAIGDVMALSVQTPDHLHKIGLLRDLPKDSETDINFLMKMALEKVAFLPFGYLIDLWRWSVFSGKTKPDHYTDDWWQLRCRLQGIYPPVKRSSNDFDPGAKYHVPSDTPYIRYFISFIIQFQFHKAACQAAGHTGPLHRCDIYNSTKAGKLIGNMLKLGASKPWPDAMEVITGQRKMDASPLLEYFHPLLEFLRNENGNDYGWSPECPVLEIPQPPRSITKDCSNDAKQVWTTWPTISVILLRLILFFLSS